MDKKETAEWDSALIELIRTARAAGVPDSETRLWRVQHIDDSLSRLIREDKYSFRVISVVNTPGALRDLARLYPERDRILFTNAAVRVIRNDTGFKFNFGGETYKIHDVDMFNVLRAVMDDFKTTPPRVM